VLVIGGAFAVFRALSGSAWYNPSVTPGQDGASIILGHVGSFTGRSVLCDLRDLTQGELGPGQQTRLDVPLSPSLIR